MGWKKKELTSKEERDLLIGMIVSTNFLSSVERILDVKLLNTTFTKKVAKWCIDYYRKYREAPKENIKDIYESECREDEDEDKEIISMFLSSISNEYENLDSFNEKFYLDKAEKYLEGRMLEILSQDIKTLVTKGDVAKAKAIVGNFKGLSLSKSNGIDVFKDPEAIISAFRDEEKEILFSLPGRLGKEIDYFHRGDFFCVMAPGKRGKTWFLEEIGIRASMAGLKVLWITLEMTEKQILRRLGQTFLAEPRYPKMVKIPIFDCNKNKNNSCVNKKRKSKTKIGEEGYIPCSVCRGTEKYEVSIYSKEVEKEGMDLKRLFRRTKALNNLARGGRFILMNFPAGTLKVSELKNHIDNLINYQDIVPDVVVVDYATILAAEDKRKEVRHQLDEKWTGLRGIAQEKHCLVVTAHHSNKSTFNKKITQEDSSEDSRIINHITGIIGLNQTPEEKKQGIMKITILGKREGDFNPNEEIIVLQCLDIGKAYLDSL